MNRDQIERAEAVAKRAERYRANVARARRVQGLAEADRWRRPASLAGGMPHRAKSVFEFTDEQMMIAIASLEKKSRK
jgi:hypothetical protein